MCGRYTLTARPARIAEHFGLVGPEPSWVPRYNIAPGTDVPLVRAVPDLGRRLDLVRWGLVPAWADDERIGRRLINARAETVAERPAFRTAFRRRRALAPADGFYEWSHAKVGRRPWWIGRAGREPFAFAALWEHWRDPGGHEVETCAILTTAANPVVASVHGRMPVLLTPGAYARWLDPAAPAATLADLLVPYAGDDLIAYPVSRRVNNPANDDAQLLDPVADQPGR